MNDKQKIKHYKKAIEDIENICVEQNLKYDTTACEVLDVIEKLCEKVVMTDKQIMTDTNYIPFELLLAGYENLSWIGKLRWNYYKIKHKIFMLFKERDSY